MEPDHEAEPIAGDVGTAESGTENGGSETGETETATCPAGAD